MLEIDYETLPVHMKSGVRAYIEEGHRPGDFLCAVFENNLVEAFSRADHINIECMLVWAKFLWNEAPQLCWGSRDKMDSWIAIGGLRGVFQKGSPHEHREEGKE